MFLPGDSLLILLEVTEGGKKIKEVTEDNSCSV